VIGKVVQIPVERVSRDVAIFFDAVLLTHRKVTELIRTPKIVSLEAFVAVFFRPDAA
jgi:hypothetical protein